MIARSSRGPAGRQGFTLVEMLVALGIFVILATITLGAFRGVSKDDQISAGAQTVKGWFEHARSRAIKTKSAYGVRFIPDASAGRYCSTVSYIAAGATDESNLDPSPGAERKWITVAYNMSGLTGRLIPGGTAIDAWRGFVDSGALPAVGGGNPLGLRIEVPKDSGHWFALQDVESDGATPPTFRIVVGSGARAMLTNLIDQRVEYRLELGPTAQSDPAPALPRGVVIDFDASQLPDNWRPGFAAAETPYPSSGLDLMFSPNGALMGRGAGAGGVLHLCLSTREDAEAIRINFQSSTPPHPQWVTSPTVPTYPFILADPKTAQKLVSVFLGSGRIGTASVNTAGDTNSVFQNELVGGAAARLYAVRGRESK